MRWEASCLTRNRRVPLDRTVRINRVIFSASRFTRFFFCRVSISRRRFVYNRGSFFTGEAGVYEWRFYAHKFYRTEQKDLYTYFVRVASSCGDAVFSFKRFSGFFLFSTSRR